MTPRALGLILVLAVLITLLWHGELYTVQRPGEQPRPLTAIDDSARRAVDADVVLPAVPIGVRRLAGGQETVLIYYWAPWQQGAYAQASELDSLRRGLERRGLQPLQIEVVCFDPFPSVARYVARRRLTLPVLLDTRGELRRRLPCPSIPYTYVLDARGRVAVRQAGRVDWLSPVTRETLERIVREPPAPPTIPSS